MTLAEPLPPIGRVSPTTIRVLDEDPDLCVGIPRDQWPLATAAALAPLVTHERGPWSYTPPQESGALGALILDGLILVRIEVDGRGHVELLGEGDLISPWVGLSPDMALPTVVSATVCAELRLAVLGRHFALRIARWPEIHAVLMQRLIERSRRLALQSAINSVARIEERLELTFWQLAFRFGRVTRSGYLLNLRLTHAQLAEMVAAQRPSVTVALARLTANGRLERQGKERWLLPGEPPSKLVALSQQTAVTP